MKRKNAINRWLLDNMGLATPHDFRALKRRQIRSVLKAIDDLRTGCAYCNGGPWHLYSAVEALEAMKEDCSVKIWGR